MGTSLAAPNCFFITGGAGSLGREIVGRLLVREPGAQIILLVRAGSEIEARARLQELENYLVKYFGVENPSGLRLVRGDINRPSLGMDPATHGELANRVTHILHCAASIKLAQPLDAARRINREGTKEVVRFARNCPRLKVFSHVSTAYVAGDRDGIIREAELDQGQAFLNAYEKSKFEAECWIRAAARELPILVFRPSIIVGDSSDGHLSCLSTIYPPLLAAVGGRIQIAPGCSDARLDLVPVDYVADAIVALTSAPFRSSATYHLAAGWNRSIPVKTLVADTLRFFEKDRASLPVPRDTRRSSRERERRAMQIFLDYVSARKDFDDSNVCRDLCGFEPPRLEPILPTLLAYCQTTRWGTVQPWMAPPRVQLAAESSSIRSDNFTPFFDTPRGAKLSS
jgi:long-chain acyl-CoA synthetase